MVFPSKKCDYMVTYTVSSVLLYTLLIKEIENPENRELETKTEIR